MSPHRNISVCTYIWTFVFLSTLKMACYNCEWKFVNSLFEAIYATDNLAFSPASIYANLRFIQTVAKGQTLQEITNIVKESVSFGLPSDARVDVIISYNESKNLIPCLPKGYDSISERANFAGPTGADNINAWIYKKTKGYIYKMKLPGMLTANTLMNSVSSININPQWKYQFTSSVKVGRKKNMLHQYGKFRYGNLEDLNAVGVSLPFYSSYFRLVVLMPNDNDLRRLSKSLLNVDLSRIPNRFKKIKLSLYFPEIKDIQMKRSLKNPLKNTFGIKQAFTKNADFGQLKACADDSYIAQFSQNGAMATDRNSAHFIASTDIQWDLYNNNTVIPADDVPLELTYSNSSDSAVQADGELQRRLEIAKLNNESESLFMYAPFDRSLFYAAIYESSVIHAGTYHVT